jgi:hypothetical protein
LQQILVGRSSSHWPKAQGVVTASYVKKEVSRQKDSPDFVPVIEYVYRANDGSEYTNNRLTFYPRKFRTEEDALTLINDYPAMSDVSVSFRPERPSDSVLVSGTTTERYAALALFAATCIFTTAGGARLTLTLLRSRGKGRNMRKGRHDLV